MRKIHLPDLPVDPNQIRTFRSFFLKGIKLLDSERKGERTEYSAYPERVRVLLDMLTALLFGQPVNIDKVRDIVDQENEEDVIWLFDLEDMVFGKLGERGPLAKRIDDITKWIVAVRGLLDEGLTATWDYYARNRWKKPKEEANPQDLEALKKALLQAGPDLESRSAEELEAMKQEREFRFFGELVVRSEEWLRSSEASDPQETQKAIRTFLASHKAFALACKTISQDRYLRRALPDPQAEVLRHLADEVLPDLAGNLEKLELAKLYPAAGVAEGLFARMVVVESADLLVRCYGHARTDTIRKVVALTTGESLSPEDEQIRKQIQKAKDRIGTYAEGRRLPTADYPEGFVQTPRDRSYSSPSTACWLGAMLRDHEIKIESTHSEDPVQGG